MANELVLNPEVNTPLLLNDNKERQVKVKLKVHPSDEVRRVKNEVTENVGTDVCIVLDVSSSMYDIVGGEFKYTGEQRMIEGEIRNIVTGGITKLDNAISSIEKLLPKLRPEDTLSLIAYEDNAHILFDGYSASQVDLIEEKLQECRRYSGNTNISGALREARLLLNKKDPMRPKKIIFLTDGRPVGDTEEASIHEGVMIAEHNISIDCLGLGDDFNFSFVAEIAKPSKGRTELLDQKDLERVERIFTELFERSQNVLATNVELKLTFSPQVRVTEHYRGVPENMYLGKVKMPADNRTVTFQLGQIETNQSYEYFFLVTVPPQEGYLGAFRLLTAEVVYNLPGISAEKESTKKSIVVEYVKDDKLAQRRNGTIETEYSLAEIMRLVEEANAHLEKSENAKAAEKYQQIIDRYNSLGMGEQVKIYRQLLTSLKENGKIETSELNLAHSTSSKAADSGELPETLTEEEEDDIF